MARVLFDTKKILGTAQEGVVVEVRASSDNAQTDDAVVLGVERKETDANGRAEFDLIPSARIHGDEGRYIAKFILNGAEVRQSEFTVLDQVDAQEFVDRVTAAAAIVPENKGKEFLDAISAEFRARGQIKDNQILVWGTDADGVKKFLVRDGSSPPSLEQINVDALIEFDEPSAIATWTDWQDLVSYTAVGGGIRQYISQVDAHATQNPRGGGDRMFVEYRILRVRGAQETVLAWGRIIPAIWRF